MNDTIARIDWQMGQTLLPTHFTAQEDALLADTRRRFRMLGVPQYGFGGVRWNDALLSEGTLSLRSLVLVLPGGELFEAPGNGAINTLNLNVTGAGQVAVYVHVTGDRAPEDPGALRYDDGEERVARVVTKLELSTEQSSARALHSIKLGEFQKDAEDLWSLADRYVPPLLQVGGCPFLLRQLEELRQAIEQFHFKLQQELAASYLGGGDLLSAKLCLRAVYCIQRVLRNVGAELRPHPATLLESLQSFYVDLCLFQNVTPEGANQPYRHDDLGPAFAAVIDAVLGRIQVSRQKTPYLPFTKKTGRFAIDELPDGVRRAREIYFLLQKPRVSDAISLEGIKLASDARLSVVHQLSLQGIPMVRIQSPPFQHQFGADVDFYLLREGEEWDQALRDGTLAFYDRPDLEGIRALLYWRNA